MSLKRLLYLCILSFLFISYFTASRYAPTVQYNKKVSMVSINSLNLSDTIKYAPNSVKMHNSIKKYCALYDVPEKLAFKIAKLETGYTGIDDSDYKHNLVSKCHALGPMQLLLSTARYIDGDKTLTRHQLLNDIELNVKIGIKYLRYLFNKYHNWVLVAGAYNTGRPVMNSYARAVALDLPKH